MDAPSPARLYAATVGALSIVLGIAGFFASASFGAPGAVGDALGALPTNAWLNLLYIATGTAGVLLAESAARGYALLAGGLFCGLAVLGFAGDGDVVLGALPAGGANGPLQLALGVAGLLAAAGTRRELRSAT